MLLRVELRSNVNYKFQKVIGNENYNSYDNILGSLVTISLKL